MHLNEKTVAATSLNRYRLRTNGIIPIIGIANRTDGVKHVVRKTSGKSIKSANSSIKRTRGESGASVYEALRWEILQLEIEPGTLLDESELAGRFGLSRSPVREALIRLSAEGLVKALRNRSSIVAPFDVASVPSYLDAITLLYRLTARLAAQNRTPEKLDKIIQLQKQHADATAQDNALEMISLNHAFHLSIAEAGGNEFYTGWTKQLLDHGQRILRLYLHIQGDHIPETVLADHEDLVQAIVERDADAAEAAARRDAEIITSRITSWFALKQSGAVRLDDALIK